MKKINLKFFQNKILIDQAETLIALIFKKGCSGCLKLYVFLNELKIQNPYFNFCLIDYDENKEILDKLKFKTVPIIVGFKNFEMNLILDNCLNFNGKEIKNFYQLINNFKKNENKIISNM